ATTFAPAMAEPEGSVTVPVSSPRPCPQAMRAEPKPTNNNPSGSTRFCITRCIDRLSCAAKPTALRAPNTAGHDSDGIDPVEDEGMSGALPMSMGSGGSGGSGYTGSGDSAEVDAARRSPFYAIETQSPGGV